MIIMVLFIVGPVPVLVSVMWTLPMMTVMNPAIVMLDSMMKSITIITFFSVVALCFLPMAGMMVRITVPGNFLVLSLSIFRVPIFSAVGPCRAGKYKNT
jgi:hypothetical protein